MNSESKHQLFSRGAVALLILLSGLAFMPFTGFSNDDLGWQRYAGVYQADLNVNHDRGAPGSAFLFTGSGYQPDTVAIVYVDGVAVGALWTDQDGGAEFLMQTEANDAPGQYFVTLATDSNTTATEDIELDAGEPVQPPPPGFEGPIFDLEADLFLPYMARP